MSHQSDLIESDIIAYLKQHERKELLRLLTCGSVDDGKSTLIGRLLHDSKMVYEDQLEAVTRDSVKSGTTGEQPDLSLLVDGLKSEREQGITIDVAYRYFSTSKRKFRSPPMCTFSSTCIRVGPLYHGMCSEGSTTLSPRRALMGRKRTSSSPSLAAKFA